MDYFSYLRWTFFPLFHFWVDHFPLTVFPSGPLQFFGGHFSVDVISVDVFFLYSVGRLDLRSTGRGFNSQPVAVSLLRNISKPLHPSGVAKSST